MSKRKQVWIYLILGLVFIAGCSRNQGAPTSGNPSAAQFPTFTPVSEAALTGLRGFGPGETAPDFRYGSSGSQTAALSDLRGKPVLLNFWASWCPPCRAEMPLLEQVYEDQSWQAKGLQFLTVSIDEDPVKAREFMTANSYTFPVILDTKQVIAEAYNVNAIPTTFFVNKSGVIETRRDGAFADKSTLERELNKIVSR